jgi:uncharacterized membrane protein
MKNRVAGLIIIGIAVIIGFITWSFNRALTNIVNTSCSHGTTCPMWGNIRFQTSISIGLMVLVVLIGLYLVFFGREEIIVTKVKKVKEQIEPKKLTKENYRKIMQSLAAEEKLVLESIISSEGSMFQSDIVAKTGLTKVKVTRILDRLEGRDIIERKRRGMTNVVILKHGLNE